MHPDQSPVSTPLQWKTAERSQTSGCRLLETNCALPDPNWKRLMAVAVKPIHIGSPEQPTQDPIFELIEGKQVVAENMDETPETPPTPTDQQELKEDQAVVTQEIEEAEEEEEEYEDNQFCSGRKRACSSAEQA
jgi:hypothetical protein